MGAKAAGGGRHCGLAAMLRGHVLIPPDGSPLLRLYFAIF